MAISPLLVVTTILEATGESCYVGVTAQGPFLEPPLRFRERDQSGLGPNGFPPGRATRTQVPSQRPTPEKTADLFDAGR